MILDHKPVFGGKGLGWNPRLPSIQCHSSASPWESQDVLMSEVNCRTCGTFSPRHRKLMAAVCIHLLVFLVKFKMLWPYVRNEDKLKGRVSAFFTRTDYYPTLLKTIHWAHLLVHLAITSELLTKIFELICSWWRPIINLERTFHYYTPIKRLTFYHILSPYRCHVRKLSLVPPIISDPVKII